MLCNGGGRGTGRGACTAILPTFGITRGVAPWLYDFHPYPPRHSDSAARSSPGGSPSGLLTFVQGGNLERRLPIIAFAASKRTGTSVCVFAATGVFRLCALGPSSEWTDSPIRTIRASRWSSTGNSLMLTRRRRHAMKWNAVTRASVTRTMATALVVAVSTIGSAPAAKGDEAKDALEAKQLVEQAKAAVDGFAGDKQTGKAVRDLIKKAKGV